MKRYLVILTIFLFALGGCTFDPANKNENKRTAIDYDYFTPDNAPPGTVIINGLKEHYNRIFDGEYPDKINHPIDASYIVMPKELHPVFRWSHRYNIPYREIGKIVNGTIKIVLLPDVEIPEEYLLDGKDYPIGYEEGGNIFDNPIFYEDPQLVKYAYIELDDVIIHNTFDIERIDNDEYINSFPIAYIQFYYFTKDGNAFIKTNNDLKPRVYHVKKGWAVCLYDELIQDYYSLARMDRVLADRGWYWQSDRYFKETEGHY